MFDQNCTRLGSRLPVALFSCVISALFASTASAQISTATITGTVTDSSGASVAGVKVSVVETTTNFESLSETNVDGIYRVQSLQPGTYDISFEAAGFKHLVQKGLLLRVGDTLPVDARLEIGQLTE
jgi:hypothetical protein